MKMKDIEVGKEYAIGPPNARYGTMSRVRGRVVRKGVHGITRGARFHESMSDKATYVEFEAIDDPEVKGGTGGAYAMTLVKDSGATRTGGERARFHSFRRDQEEKGFKSTRCLATHVVMPWDEYVTWRSEAKKNQEEAERAKEQSKQERERIRDRFEELGFRPPTIWDGFRFGQDETSRLLRAVELLSEALDEMDPDVARGRSADWLPEVKSVLGRK